MTTTSSTTSLTATELVAAYRAGEVSPVEATRASLAAIEQLDVDLNAFCLVDPDRALDQAVASEARWRRGEPCGPLDGVPTAIKDMFLTEGWPTVRGSRLIDPDQDWPEDAPSTARLREAGAVLVGKTCTPEFGWKGVTDSLLGGVTRNPWDTDRTPGGSSGGSAAAVAAGMCPLATGTDGGGSVRIPASFCGVFGFKPTYGRIPLYPPSPFGTLSHAGSLSRSVADAAVMLDVMSRPDGRDWSQVALPASSCVGALGDGVAGLRVAFSPTLGFVEVDPGVAAAVRAAADVFADLGAQVEEADPGFADPLDAFNVLWYAGVAKVLEAYPPERRHQAEPALVAVGRQGEGYSALDYLEAVAQRMNLGVVMGAFHERYDLLLTPSVPIPAFAAGREVPEGWPHDRWMTWTPFSYPFNLTQQPAASVPCGATPDGLPVGLQLVGPRHGDTRVLAACKAFEDARPWHDARPALVAG
ncbi:MAG: amidase [Marmoricola sp.]